jgi:hypothetical protein
MRIIHIITLLACLTIGCNCAYAGLYDPRLFNPWPWPSSFFDGFHLLVGGNALVALVAAATSITGILLTPLKSSGFPVQPLRQNRGA